MAKIEWTGPAARDLDEIVSFIAIDDPTAAARVTERILSHVEQLRDHPHSGSFIPELPDSSIRQLVEAPCRIFYRVDNDIVRVLHLLRFERMFRPGHVLSDDSELNG